MAPVCSKNSKEAGTAEAEKAKARGVGQEVRELTESPASVRALQADSKESSFTLSEIRNCHRV